MSSGPPVELTFRILLVCTANICRSPLAERLLAAELTGRDVEFKVTSAGTHGYEGQPMDSLAARELSRLASSNSADFRSRPLTDRLTQESDLILTATRAHRAFVLERVPQALRRTFTLLEFAELVTVVRHRLPEVTELHELVRGVAAARGEATLDDYDIADPYRQSAECHRTVAAVVSAAVGTVAHGLTP